MPQYKGLKMVPQEQSLKEMPQLKGGAGTVILTFLNAVAYSSWADCLLFAEQKAVAQNIWFDTIEQEMYFH